MIDYALDPSIIVGWNDRNHHRNILLPFIWARKKNFLLWVPEIRLCSPQEISLGFPLEDP